MRTPFIHIFLCIFIINTLSTLPARGSEFHLPTPGVRVSLSPDFKPPILKGIKVYPDNPFHFDFILDTGDHATDANNPNSQQQQLKTDASKLIKYFLTSLTVPEDDIWVNLSPYEKDHIIPNSFGLTEMGRDLLAQDYMLKQITASLIYPEDALGKQFWKRIYEEAQKKFGTTNIPVSTFNKVWIVPDKVIVYENANLATAYIVTSSLKVMLEEDYLATTKNQSQFKAHQPKDRQPGDMFQKEQQNVSSSPLPSDAALNAKAPQGNPLSRNVSTSSLSSQIIKEIILPELENEVNEGKNFARLRQVYQSLILATWYKNKIKDSILEKVYSNQNKIAGVLIDDPKEKQKIYKQYLLAYKKGVYNYIKEDINPENQEKIPRKYFSGGVILGKQVSQAMISATLDQIDEKIEEPNRNFVIVKSEIQALSNQPALSNLKPGDSWTLEEKKGFIQKQGVFSHDFNNIISYLTLIFGYGLFTRFMDIQEINDITLIVLGQPITLDLFTQEKTLQSKAELIIEKLLSKGYIKDGYGTGKKYSLNLEYDGLDDEFKNSFPEFNQGDQFEKIELILRRSIGFGQRTQNYKNSFFYDKDIKRTEEDLMLNLPYSIPQFNAFKQGCREDLLYLQEKIQTFLKSNVPHISDIIADGTFSTFLKYIEKGIKFFNDDYDFIDFNLNESLLESLQSSGLKQKGFIVEASFDNPINLHGDKYKLEDVFINIIKNAGEALEGWRMNNPNAPIGSMKIQTQVISQVGIPSAVIVRFIDNGPGMSEVTKNKLLQREKYTVGKIGGTGVGLYHSQQIVAHHKGTIEIEKTELGKGTTFKIILPIDSRTPILEIEREAKAIDQSDQNENSELGGIDLTPTFMKIQTQNNGGEIKFQINAYLLKQLHKASGFTPSITHIKPLQNIKLFLGLDK